jgi:hypothetical protein
VTAAKPVPSPALILGVLPDRDKWNLTVGRLVPPQVALRQYRGKLGGHLGKDKGK